MLSVKTFFDASDRGSIEKCRTTDLKNKIISDECEHRPRPLTPTLVTYDFFSLVS